MRQSAGLPLSRQFHGLTLRVRSIVSIVRRSLEDMPLLRSSNRFHSVWLQTLRSSGARDGRRRKMKDNRAAEVSLEAFRGTGLQA